LQPALPVAHVDGYLYVETADIFRVKPNQNRCHRKPNATSPGTTGEKQKMCSAITTLGEGLFFFRLSDGRSAFAARIVL
jgi:hypothetical protein